jgi:hypothetical protein
MAEEDILVWAKRKLGAKYNAVQSTIISRSNVSLINAASDDSDAQKELILAMVSSQYNSDPNSSYFRLLLKYCNPNLEIFIILQEKGIIVQEITILKVLNAWAKNSKEQFIKLFNETVENDTITRESDIGIVSYCY